MNIFLWVIVPYLCLASMIIGLIWRWRTDKFGWVTRSSETYERAWLRVSSPLFHYGILLVVLGHIGGLLIPESWTSALGISEGAYHFVAVSLGSLAALMTIVGLTGLLVRRYVVKSVRLATSDSDIFMYIILLAAIALGTIATISKQIFGGPHGYNYRETISPWFRSLFYFHPDYSLMVDVPWQFKAHIIAGLMLFAVLPYTRLVHAVAPPALYVARPYMVYRSRETEVGAPGAWQGGEPTPSYLQTQGKGKYRTTYTAGVKAGAKPKKK